MTRSPNYITVTWRFHPGGGGLRLEGEFTSKARSTYRMQFHIIEQAFERGSAKCHMPTHHYIPHFMACRGKFLFA